MPYIIEYSPESVDHLRALTARDRSLVLDEVDAQLSHQPTIETRNRKRMRPNPLAPWELRIGVLHAGPKVLIRAVGIKERNRVRIGWKEIEL